MRDQRRGIHGLAIRLRVQRGVAVEVGFQVGRASKGQLTGIKSDLPGDVIATVTEPVYDTATGKFLLIPQGSRILGKYNSQVSYGQSRVQVMWNRNMLQEQFARSCQPRAAAGTDEQLFFQVFFQLLDGA
ncbi:hypothetical protein AAV32_08840 [Kerstersia gyiorum]|uniref:Uncharacterized protein n=1 Tax=Kerstersia gyiorum TaxID=206506 RepID=A0A171KS35_9BURK|nr:hypothetical protein AAV32_08840 [Kerstersia gyiorum]